ncbi:MAG: cobalamin biosynthesis protein CbiX [Planctomycetes bacterium]|nr:cobalamin biosynthesis protein CbiX [Planctomycetota bacterium]
MKTRSEAGPTALLLIAHGSRRKEANEDLEHLAEVIRRRERYAFVQASYLELSEPAIAEGGAHCVAQGAHRVVMLPYFLAPGVHAHDDMIKARDELAIRFPEVEFLLAQPLGRHPLMVDIVLERAMEAEVRECHEERSKAAHQPTVSSTLAHV